MRVHFHKLLVNGMPMQISMVKQQQVIIDMVRLNLSVWILLKQTSKKERKQTHINVCCFICSTLHLWVFENVLSGSVKLHFEPYNKDK